jgi:hypothetical protein
MPSLPPDLQRVLEGIDETDRAADTLAAGLSDAQMQWQPDGGTAWSVAQCLEHLATMNVVYGTPVRKAVDAARAAGWTRRGPSSPGFFGRKFIESMEPPVRRKMRSPSQARPGSGLPREEVLRRYHEANAAIRTLVHDAAGIDVNRATFQNPFLPLIKMKVATGLQVIAAHNRRHIWQAEQVRRRADFPKHVTAGASRD